ncbi:hypothetical protein M2352_001512 [Azospirillum fermentarium]|uniref:hypothetical protein n=1 Tax=Azospirillum fermentarium TaxID=1233114 RepID=UPI002227F089|nr:hypothetical protein [Azospirillum fermentarium]MCW2245921.1 hypothetical protein [Azospirillum fermentarium]
MCGVLEEALSTITKTSGLEPDVRKTLCARLRALQAGFCGGRQDCRGCDRGFSCRQVVRMLFHANGLIPPPEDGI